MNKKQFFLLIFVGLITIAQHCQAMVTFPEKEFTTKTGRVCTLSLVTAQAEQRKVKQLLEDEFESILSTPGHQDIGVYLQSQTDSTKELIAAAHLLSPAEDRPYLYLSDMAVLIPFQKDGIGATILNYLIEYTPCSIKLYSLAATMKFYEKFGFYSFDKEDPKKMCRDRGAAADALSGARS